jgi:hypothetical protein
MKLGIMQPYLFPYIGYFQLINAVDTFVFYDDVNFIKRGWINRNNILIDGQAHLFSIPLIKASQNKLINETFINYETNWKSTLLNTIKSNYSKAPYFNDVYKLIEETINKEHQKISELAADSIIACCNYLSIDKNFELSSEKKTSTKGLEKADRLIKISKLNKASEYINPSGGKELYRKEFFNKNGVKLSFIENKILEYPQFKSDFVGGLSIIDVLMFNSKEETLNLMDQFKLV